MPDRRKKNQSEILYKILPGIVHNLRNPLAVLKLNNYYLSMINGLPPEVGRSLKDSSSSLSKIEKQLENISIFLSKKEKHFCSINDLTETAVDLTSGFAKKENASIEIKSGKKIKSILANEDSILTVFINLIIGQIEHGQKDIKISIRSKENKIYWKLEGSGSKQKSNSKEPNELLLLCEDLLNKNGTLTLKENSFLITFSITSSGALKSEI